MKLIENDQKGEKVLSEMTHDDFRIVFSSLGELVAGVRIEDFEFQTRLGCTTKELNKISEEIWNILDESGIEL